MTDSNDPLSILEFGLKVSLIFVILTGSISTIFVGGVMVTGNEVDITLTDGGVDVKITSGDYDEVPNLDSEGYELEPGTLEEESNTTSDDSDVPEYPPRISKDWDWTIRDDDDPGHITVETSEGTKVNTENIERYVITDINEYRTRNDLDAWKYSKALASTSRAHSEDMYTRDFFAHTNPDGEEPWDRFPSDDACKTAYGENLVKTYLDQSTYNAYDETETFTNEEEVGQAILNYWQESPPHNELLLTDGHDAAGVGVYITEGENRGYVVYATLNTCTFNENDPP